MGSYAGYFDVRDFDENWVRIACRKGTMIVLPEGDDVVRVHCHCLPHLFFDSLPKPSCCCRCLVFCNVQSCDLTCNKLGNLQASTIALRWMTRIMPRQCACLWASRCGRLSSGHRYRWKIALGGQTELLYSIKAAGTALLKLALSSSQ